jgi:SAM-dependent methyltransferase
MRMGLIFAEYKVLKLKDFLTGQPKTILDFGCGVGRNTLFLQKHFPQTQVYGYDVSESSLAESKKYAPLAHFLSTKDLQQSGIAFDLIFVSNVFHHIEPGQRAAVMASLVQSSQAGTQIIIFEHNPFNPVTCHLVNTCPFDKDAVLLKPKELQALFLQAGMKNIRSHYTLFFPACLKWLRFLERYLRFLPLGGQYVVSGVVG